MSQMQPAVIFTIIFWGDPMTYETSGCPSRDNVKLLAFSLIYSWVLNLAWLEAPEEMLTWNSQAKTLLF